MKTNVVVLPVALTIAFAIAFAGTQPLHAQGRGAGAQTARQLVWVSRNGEVQAPIGPRMNSILDPAISPDGSRVAVRGRQTQGEVDHLYILEGAAARRLTTNQGAERHMIFSPDGRRIAYSIQNPGGVSNLYVRPADGSGSDTPLIESTGLHKWYPSFTPDASVIVFHTHDPATNARDLGFLNIATREMGVLVADPGIQALARVSRDGRLVAYQSDQDGRPEIYVTPFPRGEPRLKVSPNGGTWPKWGNNELFYWEGNTLMAVSFIVGEVLQFRNEARKVFTGAQVGMGETNLMNSYNPEYDVSADGTRFVVVQRAGG
jgi:Tol biopolymer transport system component